MNPAQNHRADWKGDRVILSGRVEPWVRELALAEAQKHNVPVGHLIEELLLDRIGVERIQAKEVETFELPAGPFGTILADPPWRFANRRGKVAPEHGRLSRYDTLTLDEISALPVGDVAADQSHLYLWVPNALVAEGLHVMKAWGFTYKSNLVWHKVRKDGGSDGRGVGFYFRNVTELVLFGVRGSLRTQAPARSQVNLIATRKREHSRKPDELYPLIEECSPGPYLELFARHPHDGWTAWGNEAGKDVEPRGKVHRGYAGEKTATA